MFQLPRYFTIEPVQLSIKEKAIASLACLTAILLTGLLTQTYAVEQTSVLVASMGASAVILFTIPGSPLAQPWPFVGGQMLSALIGVLCAFYIRDVPLAAALAAGLAVLMMLILRCLHPPGAATALAPVLNAEQTPMPDLDFLLNPVGINVLIMLMLTWLINRLILRRDYPVRIAPPQPPRHINKTEGNWVGVSQADVEQATRDFDHFLDIGADDLLRIFTQLQLLLLQKNLGSIRCEQLMQRDIVTVEYATEVEDAWMLMQQHHLKALPVLDRARHVIGIVTQYDFLKNLKLTPYQSFQDKWLAFIKSTPTVSTDKPEAIGHIMTRKVKTLPAQAHIAELIPLVINEGHHHVPIVDENGHFVGMVFQSRLLSALFNHCTFAPIKHD
ncbi:HPP family protein [Methylomonas sp. LL1]|uniref:HPP family protein n=1 Tax=Methylomonas sp. LL1 TaxID=2785785 RepID=UPI0018C428C6|nr:HPP family protein [Methylomonas sp. LL1]QPK63345.1 HPP family protein [Methylomonas sp. LL1]